MQPEHLSKISNICDALIGAGFDTLDEQAKALGLPRSTTWTILRGNHKKSGLSPALLTRMLESRQLPGLVRAQIIEYIDAKADGRYGHNQKQRQRFISRFKRWSTLRGLNNTVTIRSRDSFSAATASSSRAFASIF